jgi:hypothetical protein
MVHRPWPVSGHGVSAFIERLTKLYRPHFLTSRRFVPFPSGSTLSFLQRLLPVPDQWREQIFADAAGAGFDLSGDRHAGGKIEEAAVDLHLHFWPVSCLTASWSIRQTRASGLPSSPGGPW